MCKLKRGYIKCPYCANGVYNIVQDENLEIKIDGQNYIRVSAVTYVDGDTKRSDLNYIPMNFCFMCGRKLSK